MPRIWIPRRLRASSTIGAIDNLTLSPLDQTILDRPNGKAQDHGMSNIATLAAPRASTVTIEPTGEAFGAIVHGIEWGEPDEATVFEITRALRRHLLLVFRGQESPSHDQLDTFFRRFGRLMSETYDGSFHYSTFSADEQEQIHRTDHFNYVVNTDEGQTELVWHCDHFQRPQYKVLSVLEAMEFGQGAVPTMFRDMYTAYEMLPFEKRGPLEHKQTVNLDPRKRDLTKWPRLADSMHPVFASHPHSGRRTLYVNEFTHRIAGMPMEESDAVIADLLAHAERTAPTYTHKWQVGDICIWDNVGLQHRRDAMESGVPRRLRVYEGVAE
ncbi:TauD/TfdA family dioxygenase [Sphingomonas crocodyli]|uniref:TauD/TfdA family dioxygenase n=2 Tax=Sphingomonas crocodyli TaxID=1979270 RepID=A0A437M677_9SPHN|nr:TauD/TfdA family dioxygenase [Sphingomonas crocodyli]